MYSIIYEASNACSEVVVSLPIMQYSKRNPPLTHLACYYFSLLFYGVCHKCSMWELLNIRQPSPYTVDASFI